MGTGPASRTAKATVKALTPQKLRRKALYTTQNRLLFGDPLPPDADLVRELHRRFKGEVVALSEYLDRDLVTSWGYDRVG